MRGWRLHISRQVTICSRWKDKQDGICAADFTIASPTPPTTWPGWFVGGTYRIVSPSMLYSVYVCTSFVWLYLYLQWIVGDFICECVCVQYSRMSWYDLMLCKFASAHINSLATICVDQAPMPSDLKWHTWSGFMDVRIENANKTVCASRQRRSRPRTPSHGSTELHSRISLKLVGY